MRSRYVSRTSFDENPPYPLENLATLGLRLKGQPNRDVGAREVHILRPYEVRLLDELISEEKNQEHRNWEIRCHESQDLFMRERPNLRRVVNDPFSVGRVEEAPSVEDEYEGGYRERVQSPIWLAPMPILLDSRNVLGESCRVLWVQRAKVKPEVGGHASQPRLQAGGGGHAGNGFEDLFRATHRVRPRPHRHETEGRKRCRYQDCDPRHSNSALSGLLGVRPNGT